MRIKDAIHGEIYINEQLIVDLIQTFEFQRLRKIKQLGVTNFVFPGAEHNRFAHSLGVYHIICLILDKFEKEDKVFYSDEEALALKVAALLHDIGHGPLSHAAENFFNYSHEDYTVNIIKHPKTEVNKILVKYDKENKTNILGIVEQLINKTYQNKAIKSLISSTIDADRMDYLLRDSYYTGAVYGTVDIHRLISYMDVMDNEIVFDIKALHTLEDFILSRYHMFIQVYLNEKSLVYEKLIKKILNRVEVLINEGFKFKTDLSLYNILQNTPIEVIDYLRVNDYNFMSIISNLYFEEDKLLKNLVSQIEKKLTFKEQSSSCEDKSIDIEKVEKFIYRSDESIYIKEKNEKIVIEELSQIFAFCKDELKIYSPPKKYKLVFDDE